MAVTGDSRISMSMTQAITICGVLIAALFGFFQYFVGGVASDVEALRDDVREVRQTVGLNTEKDVTTDADLRRAIVNTEKNVALIVSDLASVKVGFQKDFEYLTGAVTNINGATEKLFTQFDNINTRLAKIETTLNVVAKERTP